MFNKITMLNLFKSASTHEIIFRIVLKNLFITTKCSHLYVYRAVHK